MIKRILSLIISSLLLLGMIPVGGLAAEKVDISAKPDKLNWYFYSYEAEDICKSERLKAVEDENASGGITMVAATADLSAGKTSEPDITVEFESDIICKFYYAIRVRFTAQADSFFYGVNDGSYIAQYNTEKYNGQYYWVRKQIRAVPGKNTFKFRIRKQNVRIDKIIITNHPEYIPVGMGQECTNLDIYEKDGEELPSLFGYGRAPYVPQKETPRVLVNRGDIPRIKASLDHPQNKAAYSAVLKNAKGTPDVCVMNEVASSTATNYNSAASSYISANAFLYLINGDKENGRNAIEGSINFLKSIDITNHSDSNLTITSRDVGGAMFSIAQAYDWCRDLMSDAEKRIIIDYGIIIMQCLEVGWPALHLMETAWEQGHHSEVDQFKTQLSFAIAIYDEYPEFYQILAERLFGEFIPVRNGLYDGSMANTIGNGYGRDVYESYLMLLIEKMGARNVISRNYRNQAYEATFARLPSGNRFSNGDATIVSDKYYSFGTAFILSNIYKDPHLKQMAYNSKSDANTYFESPVVHLLINDVSIEPKKLESGLPLSVYCGDLTGIIYARTGWDLNKQSNNMAVMMKMSENSYQSHAHFDAGQFQIYYKGMLALDSGYYNSYNSVHSRQYYRQTVAHNCVLVRNPDNDKYFRYPSMSVYGGQNDNKINLITDPAKHIEDSKVAEVLGVDFGDNLQSPDFTYIKGDLTDAYNGNVEKYTRSFVFFNFFDEVYPGALVVFDKIEANPDYKRTWLLHTSDKPEIEGNRITARRTDQGYNGRLINETLLPSEYTTEIIGGDGMEYAVDGVQKTEYASFDTGKYRVELSPEINSKTEYFLNVLQVSDNDDSIKPLESEYIDADTHAGVKIKDRVAILAKSETRSARNVTFTVEGSEEKLHYMIDGLKEGTWSILCNGREIAKKEAGERGGTVNFEAAPGTYTLTYAHTGFKEKPMPFYDYKGEYIEDKRTYVKLGNVLQDGLKNEIITDNGVIKAPIEEVCPLLGLGKVLEKTEDGYLVSLIGLSKEFKFEELENINGVYYVDMEELKEVLRLTASYNPIAGIVTLSTGINLITSANIKNSDDPGRIFIERITARKNGIEKCVDGAAGTNWFDTYQGCSITFEFSKEETVKDIGIIWGNGKMRVYKFEILKSDNGKDFETVYEGESRSENGLEKVGLEPFNAKYVKVKGYGNTQNNYLTLCEIEFYK